MPMLQARAGSDWKLDSSHARRSSMPDLLPQCIAPGNRINEKAPKGRPAKIAPLKPPKEIQSKTCPRYAMQQILND